LETRPRLELEESKRELSWRNSVTISKVTPDWKLEFDYDHSYSRTKKIKSEYDSTENKTVTTEEIFERRNQGLDNLIVKSLGEHWSAGLQFEISSSSYSNTKLSYDIFPAVEYNIFPYSESTRKQLRILYSAGYTYSKYNDSTIYDKLEDKLFQQELQIAFQIQQKWGSVNISLEGSNYFNDFGKNRLELEGSIRIRIIKGLSLQINGSAARIHDQLSLQKGDVSDADYFLNLRELATTYNIEGSIGLTYTFGSIYNNIVNPRFGNGGGYYRRF